MSFKLLRLQNDTFEFQWGKKFHKIGILFFLNSLSLFGAFGIHLVLTKCHRLYIQHKILWHSDVVVGSMCFIAFIYYSRWTNYMKCKHSKRPLFYGECHRKIEWNTNSKRKLHIWICQIKVQNILQWKKVFTSEFMILVFQINQNKLQNKNEHTQHKKNSNCISLALTFRLTPIVEIMHQYTSKFD